MEQSGLQNGVDGSLGTSMEHYRGYSLRCADVPEAQLEGQVVLDIGGGA